MEYLSKNINKNGQVTIFIILALIIVVLVLLLFVAKKPPKIITPDEKTPQVFIEQCTKESLEKALVLISKNGGDIVPTHTVMYKSVNLSYLCYTNEFYKKCINQRPKLIEHIESEITDYITADINKCFIDLKTNLGQRYDVELNDDMSLKTELKPREVDVTIKRKFKMSRGTNIQDLETFKIGLISPMYELSETAMEIVNQESMYCNFDSLGFMITYPEFDISRYKTGDSDIIYRIVDRNTNKDLNFAIRSCVLPAGI